MNAPSADLLTFPHRHAAHCESGVVSSLIRYYGYPLSEAMAFGLSGALTFLHFPLIKLGGIPLTAYRMPAGHILKGISRRLGVKMATFRYRDPDEGMRDLDRLLGEGRILGMQTSVFWLPYFPKNMRFHFNAHNLIVYGKDGNDYLISDPVFDHVMRCPAEDLKKARFAKGRFAPKGLVYYPTEPVHDENLERIIRKSIRRTANSMLRAPIPHVGIRGIRRLARSLAKLDSPRVDDHYRKMFISSIIRMQEEIGTGGGGFRFIYASYLQEAGTLLNDPLLLECSELMTEVGDQWRLFALEGANFCRDRPGSSIRRTCDALLVCAAREEAVHRRLLSA